MSHPFFVALSALLAVLCIILAGILLRRVGRIAPEADHGMLRLNIDLLIPCLILDRVLKSDAFSDPQNLWLPPLIGFSLTALGIGCGFLVAALPAKRTGLSTWKQKRTFAACVGVLNYGFVPIPLVEALFPEGGRAMGVLFLMYLGAEISVWTLVMFSLLGRFNRKSWRHLLNGPILAILLAVPLNLLLRGGLIPTSVLDAGRPCVDFLFGPRGAVHLVGQAAIPMSLVVIGLTISEFFHRKNFRERWPTTIRISIWSCLIRLLVMPGICLAVAVFLPLTPEIRRILVIYGAMGSAIFPIVLARHYRGHAETALDTVMSNTIVSIVTLPVWIAVGLWAIP